MICEICKKEIKTGQYIVRCSKCNKTYHSSCWVKNVGCKTKDCHGAPTKQFKADDTNELLNFSNINSTSPFNPKGLKIDRCPVCKHIILNNDDIHKCNNCGTLYHSVCWEQTGKCILNCKISNPTDKTCAYCMMPINSNEEIIICPKCNIPHHKDCWDENGGCTTYGCGYKSGDLIENDIQTGTESHNLICPYCQTEIRPNEPVVYCPICNIPHHETCWNENGGCSTYGCTEKSKPADPPPVINKNNNDSCCNSCLTFVFAVIILFLLNFLGCI